MPNSPIPKLIYRRQYVASASYYMIDPVRYAPYPGICAMGYNVTMEVFQE